MLEKLTNKQKFSAIGAISLFYIELNGHKPQTNLAPGRSKLFIQNFHYPR